jgi:hypothetical protein
LNQGSYAAQQEYPRQESNKQEDRREKHQSLEWVAQKAAHGPSDLAIVIDAWVNLPEAIKAGIIAMVRAAK